MRCCDSPKLNERAITNKGETIGKKSSQRSLVPLKMCVPHGVGIARASQGGFENGEGI